MSIARAHRRLAIAMAGAGLLAFAGGAGFTLLSGLLGAAGLALAFAWQPAPRTAARLERLWVPLALVFVGRALVHVFVIRDDIVVPVVPRTKRIASTRDSRTTAPFRCPAAASATCRADTPLRGGRTVAARPGRSCPTRRIRTSSGWPQTGTSSNPPRTGGSTRPRTAVRTGTSFRAACPRATSARRIPALAERWRAPRSG